MNRYPEQKMQGLVASLLESYEKYPIISNIDSP